MSTSTQKDNNMNEGLEKDNPVYETPISEVKNPIYETITDDLKRYSHSTADHWLFSEELNFRSDSGYETVENIYLRAKACLERAFATNKLRKAEGHLTENTLPPFSVNNKLRITVELIGEDA